MYIQELKKKTLLVLRHWVTKFIINICVTVIFNACLCLCYVRVCPYRCVVASVGGWNICLLAASFP